MHTLIKVPALSCSWSVNTDQETLCNSPLLPAEVRGPAVHGNGPRWWEHHGGRFGGVMLLNTPRQRSECDRAFLKSRSEAGMLQQRPLWHGNQQKPHLKRTGWDWAGFVLGHSPRSQKSGFGMWGVQTDLYILCLSEGESLKALQAVECTRAVANIPRLVPFPSMVFIGRVILYDLHWQTKEEMGFLLLTWHFRAHFSSWPAALHRCPCILGAADGSDKSAEPRPWGPPRSAFMPLRFCRSNLRRVKLELNWPPPNPLLTLCFRTPIPCIWWFTHFVRRPDLKSRCCGRDAIPGELL